MLDKKIENTESVNRTYYNKLYKNKNKFASLIHQYISFDQQSKSKLNWNFLKPYYYKKKKKLSHLLVLDYGFGHGSFLLKIPQNEYLFGCDISSTIVNSFPDVAYLLNKHITTFLPNEIKRIFSYNSLDVIVSSHVLEHVVDDRVQLLEFFSYLKREGILLINIPINEVWQDPKHARTYTAGEAKKLLFECGFNVLECRELDYITGYLLKHEMLSVPSLFKKTSLRVLRFILAVSPDLLIDFLNTFLKKRNYLPQQLLIIASKNA